MDARAEFERCKVRTAVPQNEGPPLRPWINNHGEQVLNRGFEVIVGVRARGIDCVAVLDSAMKKRERQWRTNDEQLSPTAQSLSPEALCQLGPHSTDLCVPLSVA